MKRRFESERKNKIIELLQKNPEGMTGYDITLYLLGIDRKDIKKDRTLEYHRFYNENKNVRMLLKSMEKHGTVKISKIESSSFNPAVKKKIYVMTGK